MTQLKTGFLDRLYEVKNCWVTVFGLFSQVVFEACNLYIKPTYSNFLVGQIWMEDNFFLNAYSKSGWCDIVRKLPGNKTTQFPSTQFLWRISSNNVHSFWQVTNVFKKHEHARRQFKVVKFTKQAIVTFENAESSEYSWVWNNLVPRISGRWKTLGTSLGMTHYRLRQVRDYERYPPAEMNSKQFESRNYRDKINPLSFVKPRSHFNGQEIETFWMWIDKPVRANSPNVSTF